MAIRFSLCFLCCFLFTAEAADPVEPAPAFEIGLGYSYNQLTTSYCCEANQSGASIFGEYVFKRATRGWGARSTLGIAAEFAGSGSSSAGVYSYLFGPRFKYEWKKSHLFIYFEWEIGGARDRVTGPNLSGSQTTLAVSGFASGVKDALGAVIAERYTINFFQTEVIFLRVPDLATGNDRGRGDLRLTGGFGFRFGKR